MATGRLRLLHITEGFDGGVVTFLHHVLPAQRARGLEVTLACSPRKPEQQEADVRFLRDSGVEVCRVPMSRALHPLRDLTALISLTRLLEQREYDIVHTHCFKAGVLGRLAVRMAAPATKIVHTPHCFPFLRCRRRWVGRFCRWAESSLALRTNCLMVVSESQRQAALAAAVGTATFCALVPNALPPTCETTSSQSLALRRELGLPAECPLVGTCARLVSYKCVDHLVAAAALVRKHFPECVFLIAGDGPQRGRLLKLIHRLNLVGTVRLLGYRTDTQAILSLLDVFALCSRAEGMPYALLESARAGAARVASAVPGNIDLIEDERSGLLYPWGCIDRLAEAVVRCLADEGFRRRLSDAARRRQQAFSVDDQVDAMVHLYRQLCSGPPVHKPRSELPEDVTVGEEQSCQK